MVQKIALVLSGGGARGIAHIGVIEELERRGFEISSVSGTSMGSIVAGFYAAGKLDVYKNWICSLDKLKVFNLIDFTFSKSGLVKGDKVFNELKKIIPDILIEDLKIPYCAVATDILSNQEIRFTKGSLYSAIRASSAIPTIFTPIKDGDRLLVDGGITTNVPVNCVKRSKGDILVVVDVSANVPSYKKDNPSSKKELSVYEQKIQVFKNQLSKIMPIGSSHSLGYFDLISKTFDTMLSSHSKLLIDIYSPDILINISKDTCSIYDFYKANQLIEIGRNIANQQLDIYFKK
ncbi:patatin-like phospholipase family protein [Candidatus Woesearchaeota archaeon]|nr:patatin-like phospholipase family protein [Candidatus Woesearchaeota archaeon]